MWLLIALLACGGPASEAPAETVAYPEARRGDVVDDYHGTEVPDPYRWLEDPDADETRTWIDAQNEITEAWIGEVESRDAIAGRLEALWEYDDYGVPRERGDKRFYTFRAAGAQQPVLQVEEGDESRVLLDVNTLSDDATVSLNTWAVSEDASHLAYGVSDGGSDWVTFRVRDVQTGEDLVDVVKWAKFTEATWAPDGSGFFYGRYPEPDAKLEAKNEFHKLYFHALGTDQSEDQLVAESSNPKLGFASEVTLDGELLVLTLWEGTEEKSRVHLIHLDEDTPPVELLDAFDADYRFIGRDGDGLLFLTDKGAPRRRVVKVPLDGGSDPLTWTQVVPEAEHTLDDAELIGGTLVLSYLKDAASVLQVHSLDGALQHEIPLPGLGSVSGLDGPSRDPHAAFEFTSFTFPPSVFRVDVRNGDTEVFKRAEVDIDPTDYVTEQVFFESADGTKIPMFLTHKKGLEKTGEVPTLLYGYGGFNIPITPRFKVQRLVWMEMGGLFASANLRGGGEYGRSWHEAGTKEHKQNVFDDFAAAATWLHQSGWTSPEKTAIEGRSNGGLLVGATLQQHPELFGAASPGVGVMDMLRFQNFTIGWAWTSDYGSAEDPEMFPHLHAYSPVHNAKPDVDYPATLITTADHDDRVVPAHSFKFAAAMQHAQGGSAPVTDPVLIRIDTRAGHGAGMSVSQKVQAAADVLSFYVRALDMDVDLPPAGE